MLIECRELTFRYSQAGSAILEDFSAQFAPGGVTAVIGPSGSGKSTLLDIIGGLRPPTSGEVQLDSLPAQTKDLRSAAAWIAQSTPMLPGRTAAENAGLALLARGHTSTAARAAGARALGEFGLRDRASVVIGHLSGGEVQRVALVRCLLADSQIVLADEPTGQLDSLNTELVANAFRVLAAAGRTVIVATHDPAVWSRADVIVDLRQ